MADTQLEKIIGVQPDPGEYFVKWPLSPMMITSVLSAMPSSSISPINFTGLVRIEGSLWGSAPL